MAPQPDLSDPSTRRRLIAAVADRVIAHADELTALDSAIGDGDHGHNMKRGFEAVLGSSTRWPQWIRRSS